MNKQEQTQFIKELIASVGVGLEKDIDKIPEDWDGFELRQLIADRFAESTANMDLSRKRNYRNERFIRNL